MHFSLFDKAVQKHYLVFEKGVNVYYLFKFYFLQIQNMVGKLEDDLAIAEVQVNDIIKDVMSKKKVFLIFKTVPLICLVIRIDIHD